ncbi:MAG: CopG family transcriptional regulator [Thermodesulfobacteriota bacterium]|nr:CopG family transcriptional regulator [Thermodesulfobacteriota bacterium]
MASTVKTAISMQEELFEQVNKLAEELHVSRSKLFVMAVQDFIKKNENHDLLSQINKAFIDYPESSELKVQKSMQKKQAENLERETW